MGAMVGAQFVDSKISDSLISDLSFSDVSFVRTQFLGTTIRRCHFRKPLFEQSTLQGKLHSVTCVEPHLNGLDLSEVIYQDVSLTGYKEANVVWPQTVRSFMLRPADIAQAESAVKSKLSGASFAKYKQRADLVAGGNYLECISHDRFGFLKKDEQAIVMNELFAYRVGANETNALPEEGRL